MVLPHAAKPHSSVGNAKDFRTGGSNIRLGQSFSRIDDSHCDMIHSCLTSVRFFEGGYVGKQPVAWKNIVRSTCKKNSRKACVGALAAAI